MKRKQSGTRKVTKLTLFCDAKAKNKRFAITNAAGHPVWYDIFPSDYNGDQCTSELCAARNAVWLVSQVAQCIGGVVKLHLKVDFKGLITANSPDRKKGPGAKLRDYAKKQGVCLYVSWVKGKENPADKYTVYKENKSRLAYNLKSFAI